MTVVNKHILLESDEVMEILISAQDINLKLQTLVFDFTSKYVFHINLKQETLVTNLREYLDDHFMDEDLQELLEVFKLKPDMILSGLSVIAASLDGAITSQFAEIDYSTGLTVSATMGIYFRHHTTKLPENYKLN